MCLVETWEEASGFYFSTKKFLVNFSELIYSEEVTRYEKYEEDTSYEDMKKCAFFTFVAEDMETRIVITAVKLGVGFVKA